MVKNDGVESSPIPENYNNKMIGSSILSDDEIQFFKEIYNDEGPESLTNHENSIMLCMNSKFGFGVKATADIPKNSMLGFYFGRLCRLLPNDSEYSFKLVTPEAKSIKIKKKPLFLNAEQVSERSILA